MRWRKKKKKQQPKDGDTRIIKRFLWWPICLNDEWRWLEEVEVIQQFESYYDRPGFLPPDLHIPDWVDIGWAELE